MSATLVPPAPIPALDQDVGDAEFGRSGVECGRDARLVPHVELAHDNTPTGGLHALRRILSACLVGVKRDRNVGTGTRELFGGRLTHA